MGARSIQSMLWCLGAFGAGLLGCDDDHGGLASQMSAAQGAFSGPQFPGAGSGSAGRSIAAGLDTVSCNGLGSAPAGTQGPAPGATADSLCFFGDDPDDPAAMVEWIVESAADQELVHVRLTFNPEFVDNTYGVNAIGWSTTKKPGKPRAGHTFKDLVGSDHAEFKLFGDDGELRLHFKVDYLSEDPVAPSGYGSLGVTGGEGKMLLGSTSDILAASTSLDRNLNACMLDGYLEDSPDTDESYTPNPDAPLWDYRVVYDVWVKQEAFGSSGFGHGIVDFVHASPSKLGEHTVEVTPGECPPSWPYCEDPAGCECVAGPDLYCAPSEPMEPSCEGDDCSDGGVPPDLF